MNNRALQAHRLRPAPLRAPEQARARPRDLSRDRRPRAGARPRSRPGVTVRTERRLPTRPPSSIATRSVAGAREPAVERRRRDAARRRHHAAHVRRSAARHVRSRGDTGTGIAPERPAAALRSVLHDPPMGRAPVSGPSVSYGIVKLHRRRHPRGVASDPAQGTHRHDVHGHASRRADAPGWGGFAGDPAMETLRIRGGRRRSWHAALVVARCAIAASRCPSWTSRSRSPWTPPSGGEEASSASRTRRRTCCCSTTRCRA